MKTASTFLSSTGWRRHFWLPALVAVCASLWPQLGWACAMQSGQEAQPARRAMLCQCIGMKTGAMRSCQMPSTQCCQPIRLPAQTPAAAFTSISASKVLWASEPKDTHGCVASPTKYFGCSVLSSHTFTPRSSCLNTIFARLIWQSLKCA